MKSWRQGLSAVKKLMILQNGNRLGDIAQAFMDLGVETQVHSKVPPLGDLRAFQPDLLVLEYSVQDMSGILFYKKVTQDPELHLIPTIFIADSKSYQHRLNAFEMGATDFINRPFQREDLLRRADMHVRNRKRWVNESCIEIGNLRLEEKTETVTINGNPVALTQLEYKVLHFLLKTPKHVISRSEIYESIWGKSLSSTGRLDTQLYNLKKKLRDFSGKIKSVNKIGMRVLIDASTFYPENKTEEPQSPPPEERP